MRILYITHLNNRNGATVALLNIMKEMKMLGVEIALMTPSRSGFLYEKALEEGFVIYGDNDYALAKLWPEDNLALKRKLRLLVSALKWNFIYSWNTYKVIKDFKPDIVHCNTSVIDYALLGCRLTHTPHVWHAREYIDKDFNWKIFPSMSMLRKKMALRYNHTIAITKGVFEHFNLNGNKDIVIYDGVFSERDVPCINEVTNASNKYFLFVGAFSEGKGVHVAIEQFCKIIPQYPNVHLLIASKYKEDPYYQRCITSAKLYSDNIHFLGFRTDVYQLMAKAEALIVPSRFEGFGFVTVEAMLNNTIVIGRNTAGTKEQFDNGLEQTGNEIALRFNDENDIPNLMERVLTEDFSEMKKIAREVVMNNYSAQKNAERIYAFYNKILGRLIIEN